MNALVIYYSFEGNTKLIAKTIAKEIKADLVELKPIKEIESKGFMKYIWGGSQVMMKKRPELVPIDKNIQDYDLIFLGTPVWAWTFAPPFRTFFERNNIDKKKVALFSCHEGQNGKTFVHFKDNLRYNTFLGEIDFYAPLKSNKEISILKAKEWANEILTKAKSEV